MDTFVDERDCKLLEADGIRIKRICITERTGEDEKNQDYMYYRTGK